MSTSAPDLNALLIATLLQPETWLISDTHFGHKNIVRYCNRPENHDEVMEERWRATVADDETVLHLGDLCFKGGDVLPKDLPGQKFLMRGNHDRRTAAWYEDRGYTLLKQARLELDWNGQRVAFTHEPDIVGGWDINVHGHIHNNGYGGEYDATLDYRNISVEVMDYTPVRLRDVLDGDAYQSIRDARKADWTPRGQR